MSNHTCTKQHAPCKGCPFRRDTPAGKLGGSPVTTYVGQAHGPFWLPCHNSKGYSSETRFDTAHSQCAGGATFRANTGRADMMPDALLRMPKDTVTVFADYAEFVSHHEHIPVEFSRTLLETLSPDELLRMEFMKQSARQLQVTKE